VEPGGLFDSEPGSPLAGTWNPRQGSERRAISYQQAVWQLIAVSSCH